MAKKRRKAHKPDEANPAFIMTRLVMIDSVAFWALKPIERAILSVVEIEHMRHGGVENGRLIVTRRQFEKRGIHKDAIAPSLRALEALGFIEIERGAAGIGDQAQAHRFRLTYVQPNPTDEWRKHHNRDMARAVAETARQSADIRARRLGLRSAQKQIAGPENGTGLVRKAGPATTAKEPKMPSIGPENGTGPGPENGTTIYISVGGGPRPNTDDTPTPPVSLTAPPAPPSPAVLWAEFSPSRPRQPAPRVGTVSPSKPDAVVIERIDGAYLIGGWRVEIRGQTSRRRANVLTPPARASAFAH